MGGAKEDPLSQQFYVPTYVPVLKVLAPHRYLGTDAVAVSGATAQWAQRATAR